MQKLTEAESALETLGHMAAQCELDAADHTLTDRERIEQMIRANAYREEQCVILRSANCPISSQVAQSIVDEMLAAGAGYDSLGKWHQPEMPSKPNPWADVRPLPAESKCWRWRRNYFCVTMCFRIQRILRAVFGEK